MKREVIEDSIQLSRLLRNAFFESGTTMAGLEATSGITLGYASKILSPNPNKRMGIDIAVLLASALGYRLVLEPDAAAAKRYRDKLQLRKLAWPRGKDYDVPIGA